MTKASTAQRGRQRVADMQTGDAASGTYLVTAIDWRTKKNGEPYFFVTLRDSSASIPCVMWDGHEALQERRVVVDDFARIEGNVADFNGAKQLTLRRIEKVDETDVDIADFVAVSPRPRAEMEAELDALIESVVNPECRRLLARFFGHGRFREMYCTAPAAARIHQAWIGGLLEHTLAVVRNAVRLAEHYGPYDRDLLVTAGIFHDVGKIREYSWRRTITYTDEGRLHGHISIGASMVDAAIRALQREPEGFSELRRQHIIHLILSHHGKLEYGSPVVPKTKEALLLHYGDYTEAYLSSFVEAIDEAQERGQQWTGFNKMFEAYLYVPPSSNGHDPAAMAHSIRNAPPASIPGPDNQERPGGDDVVLDDAP